MNIMDTPVGANKPFQVYMNGEPYAGFDTDEEAVKYMQMQQGKLKTDKKSPALAATKAWTIVRK